MDLQDFEVYLPLLDKKQQAEWIEKGLKVGINRQLMFQAVLEDDDRDIRNRVKAVEKSIMGQDTTDCVDKPYDEEECEDVRITVLGDVMGDQAVANLAKKNVGGGGGGNRWWRWVLGTLLAVTLGALLIFLAWQAFYDPSKYEIIAIDPYNPRT